MTETFHPCTVTAEGPLAVVTFNRPAVRTPSTSHVARPGGDDGAAVRPRRPALSCAAPQVSRGATSPPSPAQRAAAPSRAYSLPRGGRTRRSVPRAVPAAATMGAAPARAVSPPCLTSGSAARASASASPRAASYPVPCTANRPDHPDGRHRRRRRTPHRRPDLHGLWSLTRKGGCSRGAARTSAPRRSGANPRGRRADAVACVWVSQRRAGRAGRSPSPPPRGQVATEPVTPPCSRRAAWSAGRGQVGRSSVYPNLLAWGCCSARV